jgi:hypothetical protein
VIIYRSLYCIYYDSRIKYTLDIKLYLQSTGSKREERGRSQKKHMIWTIDFLQIIIIDKEVPFYFRSFFFHVELFVLVLVPTRRWNRCDFRPLCCESAKKSGGIIEDPFNKSPMEKGIESVLNIQHYDGNEVIFSIYIKLFCYSLFFLTTPQELVDATTSEHTGMDSMCKMIEPIVTVRILIEFVSPYFSVLVSKIN